MRPLNFRILALVLPVLAAGAFAATPAPEQLLPADTLAVITIPDFQKASTNFLAGPYGQLWNDPEMKPFREKFVARFKEEMIAPLEKELGVKVEDYTVLAQGQITVAVIQNGWDGKGEQTPAWLLLVDSRDKSEDLKKQLAAVKQKWIDSGKKLKIEKIREVEFTTLVVENDELSKTLANAWNKAPGATDDDKKEKPKKLEITVGQSGSLLILGDNPKVIEKVISKQAGGLVPVLGEQAAFEASYRGLFRDATAFAWINSKPFIEQFTRRMTEVPKDKQAESLTPPPDKIISVLGLGSLNTLAFSLRQGDDGSLAQVFVGAPEATRKGLFKLFVLEAKEAAPPPFVPADVSKFNRYRVSGPKVWATLEAMLAELSPQLSALLQTSIGMIGKEKDPNFDFKKRFIANLGDDVLVIERAPRATKLEELGEPPSLTLVGSPDPEQFAQAIKAAAALSPTGGEGIKEREFLGKKIYSMPLPPGEDAKAGERSFSFAASGGYVAMSADASLLEEFLRSRESTTKPLRATAGLEEAAQRVGGMNTGLFGYDNQTETLKVTFELARSNPDMLDKFLLRSPAGEEDDEDEKDGKAGKDAKPPKKAWFDVKLLPPFEKISKYFHYSVFGGGSTAEGLGFKWFSPVPPLLKK